MPKCGFYLFPSKKKSLFYESVYEFSETVKDLRSRENCIPHIHCHRYVNYLNIKKRIDAKIKTDSKSQTKLGPDGIMCDILCVIRVRDVVPFSPSELSTFSRNPSAADPLFSAINR